MHTSYQKFLLISVTASFFMWGLIATVGPLSLNFPFLLHESIPVKTAILVTGPAFLVLGNVLMGFIADRIGRKKVFIVTMIAYALGIIIVVLATNFFILLPGLALSQFGVGGEEPPSLSLVAEDFPAVERAKQLTLVANFSNIGSAFISGLMIYESFFSTQLHSFLVSLFGPLSFLSDLTFRFFLLISSIALIIILVYSRLSLPESYRWLNVKGRKSEAENEKKKLNYKGDKEILVKPMISFAIIIMAVVGVSQYATDGLMSYIVGPVVFPNLIAQIIFVSNVGASIAGVAAMFIIGRFPRKNYLLYSFIGGVISIGIILVFYRSLTNVAIFYPLLFINLAFSEFAWSARTTLEPETVPTRLRATYIGVMRIAPITVYEIFVFLTSYFNVGVFDFVLINMLLWILGLGAASLWYFRGYETRNADIDYQ
jgi:MFS family permease